MQVAKNVSEKFSSEKECNYVLMDVNYTMCGDCFTIHANIESLYWMTETNDVICQLYISIKTIKGIMQWWPFSTSE